MLCAGISDFYTWYGYTMGGRHPQVGALVCRVFQGYSGDTPKVTDHGFLVRTFHADLLNVRGLIDTSRHPAAYG